MKQRKAQNQLCWLTTHKINYTKTSKAQCICRVSITDENATKIYIN